MFLRAAKKNRGEVSLYDPIGTDKEGNEVTLLDVLGTNSEAVSEMVENFFEERRLLEKVKNLSKRERKVLELRYGLFGGLRQTQREIARLLGISRSYVSRLEKRAIRRLTCGAFRQQRLISLKLLPKQSPKHFSHLNPLPQS